MLGVNGYLRVTNNRPRPLIHKSWMNSTKYKLAGKFNWNSNGLVEDFLHPSRMTRKKSRNFDLRREGALFYSMPCSFFLPFIPCPFLLLFLVPLFDIRYSLDFFRRYPTGGRNSFFSD
jgi:hypothetical protein